MPSSGGFFAAEAPQPRDPVDYVNRVREALQLEPLELDAALEAAASSHADYVSAHAAMFADTGLSPHTEVEGLAGYSGATLAERLAQFGFEGVVIGEVIGQHRTALGTTHAWVESLYHRLPLLNPSAARVGYGDGERPGVRAGREWPQPQAPPAGYPSGPVVTLQIGAGALEVHGGWIERAEDAQPVEATLLAKDSDPYMPRGAVALIPWEPLEALTTYRVHVEASSEQGSVSRAWTFTTRRAECDLTHQDCGLARGCYPTSDGPVCHWAGTAEIGHACAYANDCVAGAVCHQGQCFGL